MTLKLITTVTMLFSMPQIRGEGGRCGSPNPDMSKTARGSAAYADFRKRENSPC